MRQQFTRLNRAIKNARLSSQLAVDPDLTGSAELRLSAVKPKKPMREPFAKNMFLGKFDVEFLAYPEPQTHDRHREFFEWLKPIEDYINEHVNLHEIDRTRKIPDAVFDELKRLGVLRAAVEESYGGLGLTASEYTKLVETVSAVPVLGAYLTKRAAVISLISTFGTEVQKSQLLPKIATGELTPALCFSESPTGTTAEPLEAKAILNETLSHYTLSGHKTYVADARRANLFVVLAQHGSSDTYVAYKTFSAFLVPKNAEGVVVSKPIDMLGQRGLDICSVTFNDVVIPKENRLDTGKGEDEGRLFVMAMGEGKHNIGGQAIGILKRFITLLTQHLIKSKNFNVKREAHDSMHEPVGNAAATLYAMEAITYLTTGMIDTFENQDCTLEKSLLEAHCTNSCIQAVMRGAQLIGGTGYDESEDFQILIRDALALTAYDRSTVDTKIFAALLGFQHAGLTLGKAVQKYRNPFYFPLDTVKTIVKDTLNIQGPSLDLEEHLHPALRVSAMSLEKSVDNLRKGVEEMLVHYGISLVGHKMELQRLADIVIEVYSMAAVVSRASRSYCIGLRNNDDEIKVAMVYTYRTYEKVNLLFKEMKEGDWANGDMMIKQIANSTFDNKSYFAAHPLERTY